MRTKLIIGAVILVLGTWLGCNIGKKIARPKNKVVLETIQSVQKVNNRGDIKVKKEGKKTEIVKVKDGRYKVGIAGYLTGTEFICNYELFRFHDLNVNVGMNRHFVPTISLGYSLNKYAEIFIGYYGNLTVGADVRIK